MQAAGTLASGATARQVARRTRAAVRVGGLGVRALASPAANAAGKPWQFLTPPAREDQVMLGCVSYDPAVGTIWEGMRQYMIGEGGVPGFDFVLFTNYEAQVSALLGGVIDIAWNGPLAHVLAQSRHPGLVSLGMRDVDCDFRTVCLARRDAGIASVQDLAGKRVVTGASDSPQGHIVPVHWLHSMGIKPASIRACDADLGKHGDTAMGEIHALAALASGEADAAILSDMMWQRGLQGMYGLDAAALADKVTVLEQAPPVFDHCQFDTLERSWKTEAFSRALFAMDMKNPAHTEVMKLEGISKSWAPTRETGYSVFRSALTSQLASAGRRGLATRAGGCTPRAFSTSAAARAPQAGGGEGKGSAGTVGVIGGGVAGIETVRALQAKGFAVTLFEAADTVGGVWRENYLNFGVQVPKQLYEFTDLPFDEVPFGQYPTGPQTQAYIERYVAHFGLKDSMRLGVRVQSAKPTADGKGWTLVTKPSAGGAAQEHAFDKLVVCTGMYSGKNKNIPLPAGGAGAFTGEVMHSHDFRSPNQVAGKKVVVIGNGKSAVDCAVNASNSGASSVTLLSRRPHWPTPRKIANLIPFQHVFLSRLGQALVIGLRGPLPGAAPAGMSLWHTVGAPIMAGAFKLVELIFAAQFGNVTGPTSPFLKASVVTDFYGYAQVLDYEMRNKVKSGDVQWKMGAVEAFTKSGVTTGNGAEQIDCDVAIYGTGFAKDYSFFDDATRKRLNVEADGLYLFRHTVPTAVDNLAFVGSEVATISNIGTYAIQAAWVAKLWKGEMAAVGDKSEMEAEVEATKAWKRSWMPDTASRASLVLLHQTHFHDRLLKDMGVSHRRKGLNVVAEMFAPYAPADYKGVMARDPCGCGGMSGGD
eukprot:CAMPEP_0173391798 /NCGR_PEP_ID=MMETSP1356-20130122/18592_1 /TAXON_ID=77927 ORGANISM="Hemiselmis virescens, Strain PCC157" /NCGR_SAMPLE_ID=MMETSP1356 /ASSEMBLY_ACC=CAM_ASM_000847 /LENGTH=870 /DNA_ID=CAMNT_0014349487 /DNA_START=72 /DNA_END=2685 /DNA_ORIENTATION=+